VRMVTLWYGHIDRLSIPSLERLFRNGSRLVKLFGWINPRPESESASLGGSEVADTLQETEVAE